MTTLRIKNLVKKYRDKTVVDHINLTVNDGEFITLLGPSGCGKTTTLKAIAGLVEIDGGEIYFDDMLMNDVPPNQRSASMVFQTYALFPHMSVRDNVGFGLKMQKVSKAERERRVKDVLEMMGLGDLAERRPGELSGGQQQRVAVARAIVTQPRLLLFDEPLSNLDLKLRERIRIDIRELQRQLKITSIYVTHDQAEAMVISDRIVIMDQGKIVQIGDPVSIYTQPNSAFTADFMGQANMIKGTVLTSSEKGCVIETAIGQFESSDVLKNPSKEVVVFWRPEDMTFHKDGMENSLECRVVQKIFMGNLTDLFVEIKGVTLKAQINRDVDLKLGDTITMGISRDKVRAIGG